MSESDKCCQRQFILFTSVTECEGRMEGKKDREVQKGLDMTHSVTFVYCLHVMKNALTEYFLLN